jgi:hypothetical protein
VRKAAAVICAVVTLAVPPLAAATPVTERPVFVFRHAVEARPAGLRVLEVRAPVTLPSGVKDGKPWWYLLRLRLKFLADAGSTRRSLEVSALVDGYASNSILLRVRRSKRCGGEAVGWSTLDLLGGQREGQRCGAGLAIRSLNFTQLRAIRPGQRVLSIDLAGKLAAHDRLVVLPGSGVFKSRAGPGQLAFAKVHDADVLPVGQWTPVAVRLFNRGDRPVRVSNVSVSSGHGLDIRPRVRQLSRILGPDRSTEVSFRLRPHQAHGYRLIFSAESTSNSPGLEVSVAAGAEDGGVDLREVALAVAIACAAALFAVRRVLA